MTAPTRPSEPRGKSRDGGQPSRRPPEDHLRSLYASGGMAAASAAGIGVAVLMTFTVIGWVAAPHGTIGEDIADVFRTTVQAWLVGHLVGFAIPGGHVSMLPLGLVVLPGLLLFRSGRWLARSRGLTRPRQSFRAGLAIAGPYAAISGTLALVGQTDAVQPSMVRALVAGFALAFIAGGLGVLRQVLKDGAISIRGVLRQMPARVRSPLLGTLGASGVLLAAGAGLIGVALVAGFADVVAITQELSPGVVGGALLIVGQLLYLPNVIVFGTSYTVGPGFVFGTGTVVAPTGVAVGAVPLFPMLGALPDNGPAPVFSLIALGAPFLAGLVGGVLTQRGAPSAASEAAPLSGLACGITTGLVFAVLAALAGGSLGAERLSEVGPSPWQVGLVTALEVGVAAAITAWLVTWRHYRRDRRAAVATGATHATGEEDAEEGEPVRVSGVGSVVTRRLRRLALRSASWRPRLPAPRRRRSREDADTDDDLFGISYEATADADAEPGWGVAETSDERK